MVPAGCCNSPYSIRNYGPLRTLFRNGIWSLQPEIKWSRSILDLAPYDSFLRVTANGKVYKEKFCTIKQLKQAVETFTQSFSAYTCCHVIKNFPVCINAWRTKMTPLFKTSITTLWDYWHLDAYSRIARCFRSHFLNLSHFLLFGEFPKCERSSQSHCTISLSYLDEEAEVSFSAKQ